MASALQIAPKQIDVGSGQRLAERQHGEQELQRRRDILEEAERRIRQALGRRGEQQQRNRGDRAAEDQQRVGAEAELPEAALADPAAARSPRTSASGARITVSIDRPSSESTGATLRRKP